MNSYFFRRFSVPDDSRENETGGSNRMTDVQGESILRGHEERCRELIAGLTIYHAGRKVYELDKDLGDGEQIIYVNAGVQDDPELGRPRNAAH